MPVLLLLLVIIINFLGPFISLEVKQFLYALSLSIKAILVFSLPFIIFGLLFKTIVDLSQKASKIIGLIFLGVVASSFIALFVSNIVGIYIYNFDISLIIPPPSLELKAMWELRIPTLLSNSFAMLLAIALGFMASRLSPHRAERWAVIIAYYISLILKIFTYIIPVFIAGFIIKLQHDGIVTEIIKNYTLIFMVIACAQFLYISSLYYIINKFNISAFLKALKNMLPAAIAGFSTMSSAAAMPLTIIGAENNADNKELAASIIPATVNIHLVGDCFATPIFAFAILKSFAFAEPTILACLIFALYFIIAKFSIAAVPGGGIIVMLPILEAHFNFNPEMLSLITALYILFDPMITCANVLGNGAFAQFIDKACRA
jgi:Na+/H+-dicarboxylate symporter